jgi:PPM family protein phosphatase
MDLRWGAASHIGLVRTANEDAMLAQTGLFAVADGMGGHAAGEVASSLALAELRQRLDESSALEANAVIDAIRVANEAVHLRAVEQPSLRGMGTTLTLIAVSGADGDQSHFVLANVGDSRAYLFADHVLRQLTRDHSYVADLVAAGEISAEEALIHPHRHVVTRALGVEPLVAVDTWMITPEAGDRYLLCSDGLVNEIDDEAIAAILATHTDPQAAAEALVDAANQAGGRDNTTVIVLDVGGAAPADSTPVDARVVEQELGGWLPPGAADEFDDPPSTVPLAVIDAPNATAAATITPTTPPPAVTPAAVPPRRRRRLSARSIVFAAGVVGVLVAAFVILAAYGRSGYYAGFDDDGSLAVFQGRPGGVLWFQPTVETRYDLSRDDLRAEYVDRIDSNPRYSSLAAAERVLDDVAGDPGALVPVVTVPPSTTDATESPVTSTPTPTTGAGP